MRIWFNMPAPVVNIGIFNMTKPLDLNLFYM